MYMHFLNKFDYLTATTSISTLAFLTMSTLTQALAGLWLPKYSAQILLQAAKSFKFDKNTLHLTTDSFGYPAVDKMASIFLNTCAVCSST